MRKIIGIVIGGLAIAGLLTLAPTPAYAGDSADFDVTKTVVGPGPIGPYTIEVTCTGNDTTPTPSSFELNDGESQAVALDNTPTTCTVTETATQGATVSYACGNTTLATCDDDQTVTFDNGVATAQVDITNTFTTPAPAPVEAQPAFTG